MPAITRSQSRNQSCNQSNKIVPEKPHSPLIKKRKQMTKCNQVPISNLKPYKPETVSNSNYTIHCFENTGDDAEDALTALSSLDVYNVFLDNLHKELKSYDEYSPEYHKIYFIIISVLIKKFTNLYKNFYKYSAFTIYKKNGSHLLMVSDDPIDFDQFRSIKEKVLYNNDQDYSNSVFWNYAKDFEKNNTENINDICQLKRYRYLENLVRSLFSNL